MGEGALEVVSRPYFKVDRRKIFLIPLYFDNLYFVRLLNKGGNG